MKLRNKLLYLLAIVLPMGFTACGDDDDDGDIDIQPTEEITELILDKASIDVEINKTGDAKITQGSGEYRAFSSNTDIVSVELTDNVLKLSALSRGEVSVIISDKKSQYKELNVEAFYNELTVETTEINVEMRLGNSKTTRIPITKGNSGYELNLESEIASATIENDDEIVLVAEKEGEATIKLTDSYGLTLDIPVTINTTTIPYNDEELEAIMANDAIRYEFNDGNLDKDWLNYVNTTEEGLNVYGWDYLGKCFKLYFGGDKTVGEKTDAKIVYKLSWVDVKATESIKFKIIKNDGTKIWAIYSFVKDERLNFGHICQNIEP